MTTRKYTSMSQQTTLTSAVTSGATVIPVVSATTLLGGITIAANEVFTIVIDPDTSLEEIVDVTLSSGNPVSANNLTVVRAVDGSSAQSHSAGAIVRHMIIGRDLREPNVHAGTGLAVHGLGTTSSVVGTQDTQTLYNKTIVSPILTGTTENDSGMVFQGTTVDSYTTTLNVVDPTHNNTVTIPNTSGTVVLDTAAQTLTNKTITSPVITGIPTPSVSTDPANKAYVDAVAGSTTAAAASATASAASAASALTSASSAATSASSAATSASSAAASASGAGKNAIINGGMDIWQRGTSGTANGASAGSGYNADRFQNFQSGSTITVSRQATADTTNLAFIQYCARVQRNAGQTATTSLYHVHNIETTNFLPLAGKTVTYSFYARAGANYSPTSNFLVSRIDTGTGTDQNALAGYTGGVTGATTNNTLTTTWQRFSVSITIPATATEGALLIYANTTGTAGANDYFEITGVQLELGSTVTTFSRAGSSIGGELALCQRYCQSLNVLNPNGTNNAYLAMGGGTGPSSATEFIIPLKVTMRITPNLLSYLAINVSNGYSVNTAATLTISNHSTSDSLALNGGVSGTLGSVYWLATGSATASNIIWSAEL